MNAELSQMAERIEGELVAHHNGRRSGDETGHQCLFHPDLDNSASWNRPKFVDWCFVCMVAYTGKQMAEKLGIPWPQKSRNDWTEEGRWTYPTLNGPRHHVKRRNRETGDKRFVWQPDLGGIKVADLPAYPADLPERLAANPDQPVYVVEGESSADALIDAGKLACTFAGGASQKDFRCLDVLKGRDVVLWPDNDEPGRKVMDRIAAHLQRLGCTVKWLRQPDDAKPKDDAVDFLKQHSEELNRFLSLATPVGVEVNDPDDPDDPANWPTGDDLLSMPLQPVEWTIEGLIPKGGNILFAGKPKAGKSLVAYQMAVAVATGEPFLGIFPVVQGDVFLGALEDGKNRLQQRLSKIANGKSLRRLKWQIKMPRIDEGGLERLERWGKGSPCPSMAIADTLAMIRPNADQRRSIYTIDREAIDPLTEFAHRTGVTVIVVHHTNKQERSDPLDEISGSNGLVGAADGALILRRKRGSRTATLTIVNRDTGDRTITIEQDASTGMWAYVGETDDVVRSNTRQAILDAFAERPDEPLRVADVADSTGLDRATIKQRMHYMAQDGDLRRIGRGQFLCNITITRNLRNLSSPYTGTTGTQGTNSTVGLDGTKVTSYDGGSTSPNRRTAGSPPRHRKGRERSASSTGQARK